MNEHFHGPTVIAAMLKAAFEEGYGCAQAPSAPSEPAEAFWPHSQAKAHADQILKNAGDPTLGERVFGLWRAWANCSPEGDDFMGAWKKASRYMKELRRLVGNAPFDALDPKAPVLPPEDQVQP